MGVGSTLRDALAGLPAISIATLEVGLRRPRMLPLLLADVIRLKRDVLGQSLPAIRPEDLVGARPYTLRLGEPELDLNELEDFLLLKLAALLQPRRVFEIGTYIGRRTSLLAHQLDEAEIFTLDLPPDAAPEGEITDRHLVERSRSELGRLFRDRTFGSGSRITQLLGDSAEFDFAPYHRSIDLVYVDGSHSLTYVRSDTRNAMQIVRPGGVVVWDDYGSIRSEYGTTGHLEALRDRGYPVYRLGPPQRRAALRGRAVMRADAEVIERFASDPANR